MRSGLREKIRFMPFVMSSRIFSLAVTHFVNARLKCWPLILFVLVACVSGNPPALNVRVSAALPLDPDVLTGVLDNGLTWFVEPNGYP